MFPDRNSRRVLHGSCQLFACAFIILGYMVALGSHAIFKLSNVGTGGVSQAYTVHTWLGYVSLVLILFQVRAVWAPDIAELRPQLASCTCVYMF